MSRRGERHGGAPGGRPGPGPAGTEPGGAGRLGIFSWCLFDWANSAFNTVIGTFVFSVYFAGGVRADGTSWGIYGDANQGSALWGYAIGISGFLVALVSPVLGAIADQSGRRKPWTAALMAVTALATALLWFALPARDHTVYALAMVVLASVAFELATVFYNAMLPAVAPPHLLGRVSGWAWGLGYAGGLACLGVALFGLVGMGGAPPLLGITTEDAANIRATGPLVAAWYALFALPMFLFTPDRPDAGVPIGTAVRRGLAMLAETLREVRRYGAILRFLIASALYRDGLNTLFAVGGLYAAGTFGMGFDQIILFAIGLNVTAALGAAGFAFLDDAIGSKPTVLIALAGLIAFGLPLLIASDPLWFIGLSLGLGTFVGPAQAAGRTMMARLAPPDRQTEMFGLYALTGRAVAFLGPMLFAVATEWFDSQRAGMSTILLLFVIGGALLATVPEPRRAGR